MDERIITVIPPTIVPTVTQDKLYRVAAYCRVSNPTDEQSCSLETQIKYYTTRIAETYLWENAGVYGEIASGRNTSDRLEFKKLMAKCRKHKVDLILTKSISRFGRNTLDTVRALRELQLLGVDVYFEQEKIHLLDPSSQMTIEIYCSLAQQESESKSHDIKWGVDKGFKDGTSGYETFSCYGYRSDGELGLVIEPEEAEVVRWIFDLRLQGYSFGKISSALASKLILSPTGKPIWSRECISKLLKNEKYTGSVMLQKTFVDNYFTDRQTKNTGQQDRYLIKNIHEAIVSQEIFERAQDV